MKSFAIALAPTVAEPDHYSVDDTDRRDQRANEQQDPHMLLDRIDDVRNPRRGATAGNGEKKQSYEERAHAVWPSWMRDCILREQLL